MRSFNPELIVISTGFDAGREDPLGGLDVTQDCFAYMLAKLQEIQSKLVLCLEGGYNLQSLSLSSEACVRVLLGENFPLEGSERKLDLEGMKCTLVPNQIVLDLAKCAREYFGPY